MQLLLLSNVSEDADFFKSAAQEAGMSFGLVTSAEQVAQLLEKTPDTLVAVDASTEKQFKAFESVVSSKLGLFSEIMNPNKFFFIASNEFTDTPYLSQSEIFGHFVRRTYKKTDFKHFARVLRKIANKDDFKFEKLFPSEIKIQSVDVRQVNQKASIVESLRTQLNAIGFKSRVATVIATAADELIMNGIFDAPVDASGKYIYAQTPRNTPVEIEESNKVEFKLAFDGEYLAISVLDTFGSLDKKKLLNHIQKSYRDEEYKVKTNISGAGLGLANVYRSCSGILFECEMGARTQVTIFYKKTDSFKDFKDQFRFLSTLMHFSS